MNLYFISGLGADKRVFQKLVVPAPFIIHHVEWAPVAPGETLARYCDKLAGQINQEEPFSLVGLSFGGVVAIELSRRIRPVQTVLISSISRPEEAGKTYSVLGKLKLQKIIPVRFFLKPSWILFRLFGAHTREEKTLLRNILRDTDPVFFQWALDRMFSWKNEWKPPGLVHFHGSIDKILPYNEHMHAIKIDRGEHLMVYSMAKKISELLREHLLEK